MPAGLGERESSRESRVFAAIEEGPVVAEQKPPCVGPAPVRQSLGLDTHDDQVRRDGYLQMVNRAGIVVEGGVERNVDPARLDA